jgi:hypothetical protein
LLKPVGLLKECDDIRRTWREQIERGWTQSQAGQLTDGPKAIEEIKSRAEDPDEDARVSERYRLTPEAEANVERLLKNNKQ